jgi:hypothetical protein
MGGTEGHQADQIDEYKPKQRVYVDSYNGSPPQTGREPNKEQWKPAPIEHSTRRRATGPHSEGG